MNLSPSRSSIDPQESPDDSLSKSIRNSTLSNQHAIKLSEWLRNAGSANGVTEDPVEIITTTRAISVGREHHEISELYENLEVGLIKVVYGSNAIELAGSDYDITVRLCQQVFRGLPVVIETRTPEYAQGLKDMQSRQPTCSADAELRSRLEIVQHAKALDHMINEFVLARKPMDERLILDTHLILYGQLDDTIAGLYRRDEVAARFGLKQKSVFIRASAVPRYMAQMVKDLAEESTKAIDPYELAARYAHRFVNIHPFMDGNGRMQRIIMNAILRYAGHVVPLGEKPDDREPFLMQAWRASRAFHQEDGETDEQDWKGHRELAQMVLTRSRSSLRKMRDWGQKVSKGSIAR